jgi:hypothetical protein
VKVRDDVFRGIDNEAILFAKRKDMLGHLFGLLMKGLGR